MISFFHPTRWLAHLVGLVWGAPTARRALRLSARLYRPKTARARWRSFRFIARTLWYGRTSAQWFEFIDANRFRRRLIRLHPSLAEKLHRPYRRCDLDAAARLSYLIAHYLAVEALGWESIVLSLCVQPLTIAVFMGKDMIERRLQLDHSNQFAKEGELCMHLCCGQKRVFSAAWSFLGSPAASADISNLCLDIGCLQGPDDRAAQDLVRTTTKALHRSRPRDFLVTAMGFLAGAASAQSLIGVASSRHVYRHWRKRRDISFDYDSFWIERDGLKRSDGDYELLLDSECTSIEQVPSNKRAEARRRQALTADVQSQITGAIVAGTRHATRHRTPAFARTGEPVEISAARID